MGRQVGLVLCVMAMPQCPASGPTPCRKGREARCCWTGTMSMGMGCDPQLVQPKYKLIG